MIYRRDLIEKSWRQSIGHLNDTEQDKDLPIVGTPQKRHDRLGLKQAFLILHHTSHTRYVFFGVPPQACGVWWIWTTQSNEVMYTKGSYRNNRLRIEAIDGADAALGGIISSVELPSPTVPNLFMGWSKRRFHTPTREISRPLTDGICYVPGPGVGLNQQDCHSGSGSIWCNVTKISV